MLPATTQSLEQQLEGAWCLCNELKQQVLQYEEQEADRSFARDALFNTSVSSAAIDASLDDFLSARDPRSARSDHMRSGLSTVLSSPRLPSTQIFIRTASPSSMRLT